jgi:hypothetical protein
MKGLASEIYVHDSIYEGFVADKHRDRSRPGVVRAGSTWSGDSRVAVVAAAVRALP